MCDETFSQSSWNTLKFNSIYTLNITLTLIQLELIKNNILGSSTNISKRYVI